MEVRLTKISGRFCDTWDEFKDRQQGLRPGENLPVNYVAQGELLAPIEPGKPILVLRKTRSQEEDIIVEKTGRFKSSPVVTVHESKTGMVVVTENSTYKVEFVS